jgi:hypothetical protein
MAWKIPLRGRWGDGFNWNRAFEEMVYNLQGREHIGMLTERFLEMGFE